MTPDQRKDIIDTMIIKLLGTPYRWGGDDPMAGFDCSGGVLEILRSAGMYPHKGDATAKDLYRHFTKLNQGRTVPFGSKPEFGDLVFFGTKPDDISHIAMMVNDEIMFEFGGGGSKTTTADAAIQQNAYGRYRPMAIRSDCFAIVRMLDLQPSS